MTPFPPEPELNPYRPPHAALEVQAPSTWPQEPAPPRPIAVWLLSLLLLALGCLCVLGALRSLWAVMTHLSWTWDYGALTLGVGWRIVVAGGAVSLLPGAFLGRKWARWPCALVLLGFCLLVIFRAAASQDGSEAERAGGRLWIFIVGLPLTAKAKRFFRVSGSPTP
jgi:hypothetical protein